MRLFSKREQDPYDTLAHNGIYPQDLRKIALLGLALCGIHITNQWKQDFTYVDTLLKSDDSKGLSLTIDRQSRDNKTTVLYIHSTSGGEYSVEFYRVKPPQGELITTLELGEKSLKIEKGKMFALNQPPFINHMKNSCMMRISTFEGEKEIHRTLVY